MLTVLGGLGEFERKLIRAGTDEGRKRAKEQEIVRKVPEANGASDVEGEGLAPRREAVAEIERSYSGRHSMSCVPGAYHGAPSAEH
jgi:hypothetical protein